MGAESLLISNGRPRSPAVSIFARNWSTFFLLLMVVVFSFTGRNFLALANFQNILHLSVTALLLASAETFVIVTRGIDMSVGFVMGLSSVSAASTMQVLYAAGFPAAAATLLGIVVGMAASLASGLAAGILISRYRVPSFIATLGTQGVAIGVTLHICGGFPVGFLPPGITEIGNGYLFYYHPASGLWRFLARPEGIAQSQLREVIRVFPLSLILLAVVLAMLWHLLRNTRFGQHTYAIGGNIDAALRAGIDVRRHLLVIYLLSACLAGLAGVVNVFQTGIGNYTPFGANYELFAVAAVIIGGASLLGGRGRVTASAVGVIVLAVLENGLNLSGVEPFYRYIAVGFILAVAVVIDQLFPDLF